MNELLEIAERLNGYCKDRHYEIVEAARCGDGWILKIAVLEPEENGKENGEVAK